MPENPIYDPNKIVKRAYTNDSNTYNQVQSTDGEIPKYNPEKVVKKGYVEQQPFQQEGFSPEKYTLTPEVDNIESTLDFIQKNSKRVMRDDEKDILRDMFKNPNVTKEDISDAIVTLQGKKAKQQDNTWTTPDYYMEMDEKGVYKPVALGLGEKTPKGKEEISIWGTQKKANDDAWYTDVAKTAFNIIPGVIGGVVDVAQLGTELVTGEESDWLKQTQAATEYLKFKKDIDIEKPIYNTEDINKFTDLFDSKRVDLSPETIWGTALSAAGFMGEMLVPSSLIAKGAKGYKAGKAGLAAIEEAGGISNLAKKASVFAGSFMTQIGDVMDSSSEAGLEGRAKALYDLTIGSALALVDAKYDVGGKILTNKLAQDTKKEVLSDIGKNIVKDEFGNITKESLNKATKEAMTAYTPVVSSFAKNYGKDVLDEVKDEVLQSFIEKSGQNLYDKLSPEDKAKFGTDAFSPQSVGEYINSAISGLAGSIVPSVMSAKSKQKTDYKAQSNSAYETVMQGDEAVKAFKTNITNAYETGQINKEDYDNAILKINTYDNYNKTTKDLSLNDENRKKLFELSLQKENLKASIKEAEAKDTEGHSRLDKMNPAELGLHNAKMKQAKALQDEIDLIVSKSEILQQPEVPEKIVEKVIKEEEKAAETPKVKEGVKSEIGAILGRQYKVKTPPTAEVSVPKGTAYVPPAKVLQEKRKMEEIPNEEFNSPSFDVTVKQHKLADALDATPEKTTIGTLQQDNIFEKEVDGKKQLVQTFNITLPDGKTARFASSKVRYPEENAVGGFRGNTYEENLTNRENPIGQKLGATVRTLKDSGRKVIFLWNADEGPKYGKHVGMVKERLRGKSDYSEADLEEMADLRMINMGQNPNAPAPGIITPTEPTEGGPKASVPFTITRGMRQQLSDLGYKKADIQDMTPQEANDIIEKQATKPKAKKETLAEVEVKGKKGEKIKVKKAPKELSLEKKESIAKRQAFMDSVRGTSKLVFAYNNLTKKQKRSKDGIDLYNKIQKKADELGYSTEISPKGTLKLITDKGKQVYKTPVKRTEDQKAMEAERKRALNAEPISIKHSVILDVANGLQFNLQSLKKYFSDSELKEMPSLMKNNKGGGINLEFYKLHYEESLGLKEELDLDPDDIAQEVADVLKNYFTKNYREAAIQDAIDINFEIENQGLTRSQVEGLAELEKEQEIERKQEEEYRKEAEDILAQEDLEKEEYRRQAEQEEYKSDRTPDVRNNIIRAYKDKSVINLPTSLLKDLMEFDRTKDFSINDKETGPENIKKLKDSIQKEGLKEPLEIAINSKGAIVLSEGNHRLQALIELGYTQIPVKVIGRASKDEYFTEVRQGKTIQLGLNLNKDFNIEPAKEEGYYQKAKVKPATLNKFEKSVDLFYKTKDADGASKKRSLAAERREFLEKNPTVKYIDDNMKYIYNQLENQNIIERKGECP